MAPHTPGGTESVLLRQPWESRFGSSCENGVIKAEQWAGLMPSTWFQRKESLSITSSVAWKNSTFSGL